MTLDRLRKVRLLRLARLEAGAMDQLYAEPKGTARLLGADGDETGTSETSGSGTSETSGSGTGETSGSGTGETSGSGTGETSGSGEGEAETDEE